MRVIVAPVGLLLLEAGANFCSDIDAIMTEPAGGHFSGAAYWFKGDQYMKYDTVADEPVAGYPKKISVGWPGLPDHDINAVFTDAATNASYFFEKDEVYKWDTPTDKLVQGYPKSIASEFPGLPFEFCDDIGMAFAETPIGKRYGSAYFLKGSKYVQYNLSSKIPGIAGNISDLISGNMPSADIDAALVEPIHAGLARYIYFMKGDHYWKWDMITESQVPENPTIEAGFKMDCVAPPTPYPPPPLHDWDCHLQKKSSLSRDILISDTVTFGHIEECQGNCSLMAPSCVAVNWCQKSQECHAKVGSLDHLYTHDTFMASLDDDSEVVSCFDMNSTDSMSWVL